MELESFETTRNHEWKDKEINFDHSINDLFIGEGRIFDEIQILLAQEVGNFEKCKKANASRTNLLVRKTQNGYSIYSQNLPRLSPQTYKSDL